MAVLSLEQIADINKRDLGIPGRFYEDVEGYIYIGKGKRLFKFAKCSEVSLDGVDGLGDNVCDALNTLTGQIEVIDERVSVIEADYSTKCFSVAMAVAL